MMEFGVNKWPVEADSIVCGYEVSNTPPELGSICHRWHVRNSKKLAVLELKLIGFVCIYAEQGVQ